MAKNPIFAEKTNRIEIRLSEDERFVQIANEILKLGVVLAEQSSIVQGSPGWSQMDRIVK